MPATIPMSLIDEIAVLFAGQGARDYLGEPVTQAAHMLQTAALAAAAGAPAPLVAAALLHDVGHFTGLVGGERPTAGADDRHSETGARWLGGWFPPVVTEPVRLHVAAKRYLCAVEPGYAAKLSAASVFTLGLQGGPMSAAEAERFGRAPHGADAVALRRWDEAAKEPGAVVPGFDHYRALLQRELVAGVGRGPTRLSP